MTAPRETEAIVALDLPNADAALAMVARLEGTCRFFKVGHELFTASGPALVERLVSAANDVFLDLKFHDIPNTVRGGTRSAAGLGVRLVTVHASGGRAMLEAAVEGAGDRCGVLAVTILTSHDPASLGEAWGKAGVDVTAEVRRLAQLASGAGCHGVVCSGEEAAAVHRAEPRLALLVPGIRPAGAEQGDQVRVVTPEAARAAGARYIVVGRPVTQAPDPAAAMAAIQRSLGR